MKSNAIVWFEIYVQDMQRAKRFYEAVLDIKLEKMPVPTAEMDMEMWAFPSDKATAQTSYGAGGMLVKTEGFPSTERQSLSRWSQQPKPARAHRFADMFAQSSSFAPANRRSRGRCAIKPRSAPELQRWAALTRSAFTTMATYVDLNGVRTWFDEQGSGEPLVLLHPGLVDSRAFGPNRDSLAARFRTFALDRRGHGHTPDVGPITFKLMAEDTIYFLEQVVGGRARLLGCSDGAVVALLVALHRPELVSRLVFVGGVFHHEGWLPGVIDSNNKPPEFLAASYGEVSPDGAAHFPVVVEKLARLHLIEPALTAADLSQVTSRTLVMLGDDDEVALEHALALYRTLPNSELAVIPGTSHGLLVEKPELCNGIILDFLCNEPVHTLAPIRRASASLGTRGTSEGAAQ